MILQLAQQQETIGLLQTVLDGGLPLMLLIALCIVGYLYKKEKEAKEIEIIARVSVLVEHSREIGTLKTNYSDKVESLMRERLESETTLQKTLLEAKDAMSAVALAMNNVQDTLESLAEA
jgi:hypothetical protein